MATRLQEIKIGDSDSEYDNPNLASLTLGNNVLLKKIDVRNCSGLGDTTIEGHTQTVVDISGCSIVEEVYFDGTNVAGVTLPNGGVLKKLHLPGTITNLTIMNQKAITELVVPSYSNISTLRLENVPTVNSKAILSAVPANTRVRLIGIAWEAEDADEIEDLLDTLDTMRGLDEAGNNMETAQVSGTIHTGSLTGAQIASYNARYPYLTVTADNVTSYLTLKSYDGETTLDTIVCYNGVPQESIPSVPARPNSSDGHYSYTGIGWNTEYDTQVADPTAVTDVIADRTVYPAYTWVVRTYTVTWKNGSTTIETDSNVPWGTMPHYDGATPTQDGQTSTGWSPALAPVTGNVTYTAVYLPTYQVRFYNGSTLLQTVMVPEGQTAVYTGETPTSEEGDFSGWDHELTNVHAAFDTYALFDIVIVEPDLKYLVYTVDDVNMTMTITGLNTAQIVTDGLTIITIPDTIQGYHVILA